MSDADQNLIAEANHRIANTLMLLVSLIRLQANAVSAAKAPPTIAEARLMLESLAARITMIAQLQRLLAHAPQDSSIELNTHLREVCTTLVSALSPPEQKVHVEYAGVECFVFTQHIQPLMLILCEIFLNAMKYAHPANVPLRMRIGCHSGADGILIIEAEDDGVGVPEGFDPEKDGGLGFRVIRSLVQEIGGSLEIESSPLGLAFRIEVPGAVRPKLKIA